LAPPPVDYSPEALAFMGGLNGAPYMYPLLIAVQLGGAILLLLDWWTPLVLVIMAPVTLNIILFHVTMTPRLLLGIALPGVIVFVLNVALLWMYRGHYLNMLHRRNKVG
jgi:putative oxidoreductase